MHKNDYIIIDLETTGLSPQNDAIIEIAAVRLKRGIVVDQFASLVNPGRPIPEEIIDLTGIDNKMVKDAPFIEELLPELKAFIGEATPIAHNASFDSSFLAYYLSGTDNWLDSITLAQVAYPTLGTYSLSHITTSLDIANNTAHRALGDALATAELVALSLNKLAHLDDNSKRALCALSQGDDSSFGELIRYHCQTADTGDDDPFIHYKPYFDFGNKKDKNRKPVDDSYLIDPQKIDSYLMSGGIYEQKIAGFEFREQQLCMAQAVTEAFNEKKFLLVEAGTGTGKSLAYLLPSVIFALESGIKVGVSTHTISLQEQILFKDIPMLKELIGQDFAAKILKGRSNYLCFNLFFSLCHNITGERMRHFLMRILSWLASSQSGDAGELHLNNYDKAFWLQMAASKENCLYPNCPYGKNSCYLYKNRREAEAADIFILNHSLLLADATLEGGFLPSLPYLIIDEAHHLEKTAEDQLSLVIDFFAILNMFSRLERKERGRLTGILPQLAKYGNSLFAAAEDNALFTEKMDFLQKNLDLTVNKGREFFTTLQGIYAAESTGSHYFPLSIRIVEDIRFSDNWLQGEEAADVFAASLRDFSISMLDLWGVLQAREIETEETIPGKDELQSIAHQMRYIADSISTIFGEPQEDFVTWVEFIDADKFPIIHMAPLDLGDALCKTVYEGREALILTSATLTAGDNFDFFKERAGLNLLPYKPQELFLPSPFYYREQTMVGICNDLPDFSKVSEIVCLDAIAQALIELISASQGRAIVLFTSHAQLKGVYQLIRRPLKQLGITVLAQGLSSTPKHLLTRLKTEDNCCILGANSFWEGIDVVGSALSLVVVVRLPFWPPNTPMMAARIEKLQQEGRDAFGEYTLPQALIRFKQGFGRLIRTGEDCGCFCVLDRRILEKRYGSQFVQVLPDTTLYRGTTKEIAEKVAAFLP